MKQIITLFAMAFALGAGISQPMNDDCTGIIALGDAPICPSPAIYSNVDATESDIGNDNFPPCFNGTPQRDVWFSFVATAAVLNYEITLSGAGGAPISNPQIALYRGDCGFDEMVFLDCAAAINGEQEVTITVNGLTPGITYFIRANDWSTSATPNWGAFELCIQEYVQTEFTINQTGSNLCTGTLYDTGGPNGNYGNNENHVFTICPDEPQECLVLTLSQFNIQNGGDDLSFYDGPNTNSPVISMLSDGTTLANGNNLGGVCYQVVASSGCLTVAFTSNNNGNFEGFAGTWQCTNDCPQSSALNLNLGVNASALEDALQNPFFDVTVTDINCDNGAYGIFQEADNTTLGMSDGLLLTTGDASEVTNPASFHADNALNGPGDGDLDFLDQTFGIGGSFGTRDVCSVELDIFAKTNRIGFDYVFGSEEYEEDFSPFSDDLMAVLISGPGVAGMPGLNGQQNLAWLPGATNTSLIQIQQVNATNNWEYFRNNLNSETIVYNGLTSDYLGSSKTLLAARNVNACATYHVKIAIGDTDENDDSGLFIKSSSKGMPFVGVDFNTGIDYLVEGCTNTPATLTINLAAPQVTAAGFNISLAGSATQGVDYELNVPGTIFIPAGETQASFPITAIADGVPEGTETIEITLTSNFGCGDVELSTLTVELKDELDVNIEASDTVFVCDGIFTTDLLVTGAAEYDWQPASLFNNPHSGNPQVTTMTSQMVTVTGTLGTCSDSDQVFLQVVSPDINISPAGPVDICEGEIVQLNAVNNVANSGFSWSPETGLETPLLPLTNAQPTVSTTYTATVSAAGGCTATDEVTINVEPYKFPSWVATDTTICQNSSVQLAAEVPNTSTTFVWTPDTWLDNDSISNALATPDQTTTYNLTATSINGLCSESESVTLTVLPADVEIAPDTIYICLGEYADISATTSTGGQGLTWSPTDSLVLGDQQNVVVNPVVSTWYFATLEVGECTVVDSVFIRVDSLPTMMDIEAIPAKETYCEGEVVSLVSPNYELAFFPDIMFQWNPSTGAVSPDSLYNLAISAIATTTYIRETTNNACSASDTIDIVVIPVANITVTPTNPSICPGESVDLLATADQPIDSWEWSPSVGLSCTDCIDPTATPPGTITYQVQGKFMGCPSNAQVTVQVLSDPNYAFPTNPFICLGNSIVLNTIVDPNANYQWLNENGTMFSDIAQPEVSPTVTTTYQLVIDNGVCPAISDEITIIVQEDFTVTAGSDIESCWDSPIQLVATASDPNVSLVWSDINGNSVPATIPPNTLAPGSTTTFFVTGVDPASCFSHQAAVIVEIFDDFTLTASEDQTISAGETATVTASAEPPGIELIWTEESTGTVVGNGNNLSITPCNSDRYIVEGLHPNGCPSRFDTVAVTVVSSFTLDTINSVQFDTLENIYEGEVLASNPDVTPDQIPGASYEWFLDGVLVASGNTPNSGDFNVPELPTGVESQEINLLVTVTAAGGCSQSLDTTFIVYNNPVEVPNVFTPNGDGDNDTFSAVSIVPVEVVQLRIWNRWGKLVFESKEGEETWNGQLNDKAATSDVYIYKLQYSIAGGTNIYTEQGDVTLLR